MPKEAIMNSVARDTTFAEKNRVHIEQPNRNRNILLTLGLTGVIALLLWLLGGLGSDKLNGALTLFAIWGVATVSLNLINGTLGILSLGHHGFMLIGGYAFALLTLPDRDRENLIASGRSELTPFTAGISMSHWLEAIGLGALTTDETLWVRLVLATFVGGLVAAVFGLIVGIPSLRLRGDYLAIVTFGFGEIIRLSASTRIFSPLTNGALGFAGVPSIGFGKNIWWTFAFLALTVFVISKLKYSSYGRAMEGIREDQIAAQAMGVNLPYHKVLGFVISAFFAGIAGALWTSWLGNARLDNFGFALTFFFLVSLSAGGTGSITGVLIGTALVIFVRQYGDPLEEAYAVSTWIILAGVILLGSALAVYIYRTLQRARPRVVPAMYVLGGLGILGIILGLIAPGLGIFQQDFRGFGMRAIFLSLLLIVIMIFRPEGIVGRREFSWAWMFRERRDEPTDEERKQDAWLSNAELNRPGGAAGKEKAEG
jgi:branched-chain amino acid transport system permease protein